MNTPRVLRLTGKTRRGENKISEHGDTWVVIAESPHVPCLSSPGFLIRSVKTQDKRWIRKTNDNHFDYVEVTVESGVEYAATGAS